MKKLIAFALALMMIFALSACGGSANTPVSGETTADTAPALSDTSSLSDETTAEQPVATERFVYEHVVIIGVDGAGQYIRDAETPNFDRIFENGSVTYGAYASNPTVSAQCWGSMMTGVKPALHGRTNSNLATEKYPVTEFPSIFKQIKDAHPDAVLGTYCDWAPLVYGLVEEGIEYSFENCRDQYLGRFIKRFIVENKPEFLFIQYDSVDGKGHSDGYGSAAQLEQINVIDGYINDVYSAIEEAGIADSTLFIVIADHGGTNNGEGNEADHGGWTDSEKYDTFAVVGKSVKKGEMGYANVRDVAAVVLYALGIEAPEFNPQGWTAQIPENIFTDDTIPLYDRSIYTDDGSDAE